MDMWDAADDAELEDAVDAARNARIVIMNPPFSNRNKMGEKFPPETQRFLRERANLMEYKLTQADPALLEFADKELYWTALRRSCRPLCRTDGWNPDDDQPDNSAHCALWSERASNTGAALPHPYSTHRTLAPSEFTLSQNVEIDECMVIAVRLSGNRPPTRFIHLDQMPAR